MNWTKLEHFGESLLGQLLPIVGGLVAANNPLFVPIIQIAVKAAQAELDHMANGGTPSPADPAIAVLGQAAVAAAAQKAVNNSNDPAHQAVIIAASNVLQTGIQTGLGAVTNQDHSNN